jgi:hypothetical protein
MARDLYLKIMAISVKEFRLGVTNTDIHWDMKIDFDDKVGLTFWEFYDSFFELIDNGVKSRKFHEYVWAVKMIGDSVRQYNVKYEPTKLSDLREPHHDWMYKLLGEPIPERATIWNEWRVKVMLTDYSRPKSVFMKRITIG